MSPFLVLGETRVLCRFYRYQNYKSGWIPVDDPADAIQGVPECHHPERQHRKHILEPFARCPHNPNFYDQRACGYYEPESQTTLTEFLQEGVQ